MKGRPFLTLTILALTFFAFPAPSSAQGQPTVAKDSVQLTAFTYSSYKGNYDTFSWVPLITYRVNGPIPSGGQLYVEYTVPGSPAVRFDCETGETPADRWWKTTCGGREGVPEEKATTYTGPFNFAIKLRNELAGTDTTIFMGKAKVAKVHSNEISTGKFANHNVYYVDHDWNLPIGYVYYTADDLKGWDRPMLNVTFWVRGEAYKLDTSLAASNKLGTDRLIVPVQIIGDQDGTWDKAAWKTDAFYGNPLTGFTPAP